jgi:hypothetical protein
LLGTRNGTNADDVFEAGVIPRVKVIVEKNDWPCGRQPTSSSLQQCKPIGRKSERKVFRVVEEFIFVTWVKLCISECMEVFTIVDVMGNTRLGCLLDNGSVTNFLEHIGAPEAGLELGNERSIMELTAWTTSCSVSSFVAEGAEDAVLVLAEEAAA